LWFGNGLHEMLMKGYGDAIARALLSDIVALNAGSGLGSNSTST
jgi:hypothetical protein